MSRQHFGLTHIPLGKNVKTLWDDGNQFSQFTTQFQWLLDSPGIGMLTGEAGVGKTAALRHIAKDINPHRYQLIYMSETDFGRVDLYRHLALALGLETSFRRAQLWRDIKARVTELFDGKNLMPVWLIDEAQNLPKEFFRDLPSFLNFAYDSKSIMTIWFIGLPQLAQLIDRAPYAALASRISARAYLRPIVERDRFSAMLEHAFKEAGSHSKILSDSGVEILRQTSQGKPRLVSRVLNTAMRLAAAKGLTHLTDDILQMAIEELK